MVQRSPAYIVPATVQRLPLSAAVLILFVLFSSTARAQDSFEEDTVNISAITVTAPASTRLAPWSVVRLEPDLISRNDGGDVASVLQSASLLYVKRYGNHGLASVSVRGLSGSHTLVTWNGLPLNSPGNGYADFTIIPVMALSSVRITSGGADLEDITGYIGGKVELGSDPEFDAGRMASVSLNAGSYSHYSSSGTISFSGPKTSIRLGAWAGAGRNDFRFINEDAPGGPAEERRSNASFSSGGMTGDMAYRHGKSQISAHLWYNDSDRELPGPVTTVQQDFGERQTDRSLRGVVKFSSEQGKLSVGFMTGITGDINRYYHQVPDYNGDNSSLTFTSRLRMGYRITERTLLVLHAGEAAERAGSMGYEEREARNIFSLSAGLRSNPFPRLNLLFQVRQMAVSDMKVSPEFTAGTTWMVTASGEHLLRANFSRNIKLPCFNDLYWIPGGNSSLVPEQSTGGEISWSFVTIASTAARNTLDLAIHASHVSDMIQWIPGPSAYWQAVNLRSVNVTGAEARAGTEKLINDYMLSGYLNYAFTRSVIADSDIPNDRSAGRQLIYAPLHHANLNFGIERRWFNAGMAAAWESRRYTTSDNSEWLPAAFMADASAGATITSGHIKINTELKVYNLFNISSESVRNYPMPLRTVNLKLTLTWSEKSKDHEEIP